MRESRLLHSGDIRHRFPEPLNKWVKNIFDRPEPSILGEKLEVGRQQTESRIAVETKRFLRIFHCDFRV
jgi:hypothetical protein